MRADPGRPCSPARRSRARVSLAPGLLLAATLAAAPAALADIVTPSWSGLPWRSGTSGIPNCLAALRGRAVDADTLFLGNPNFPALVWQTSHLRAYTGPPLRVVSLPLLPADNKGQFAQCAAGAFDGYFRQIGANLRRAGAPGTVVRLGWEANLGSKSHYWG